MSEENPNLNIPIEGENVEGTKNRSELSLEEIAAEIARRGDKKPAAEKIVKPNHVDPLEIDPNDVPVVEEEEEEEETYDPRFEGKTNEDLQDMYLNLEHLQQSQTDELGTLRKENKTLKAEDLLGSSSGLEQIGEKIMPTVESWSPEKREEWNELFKTEPEKAINQVVKILLKPSMKKLVLAERKEEIVRLKTKHKDSVVPYVEKDVNELIRTNPNWWDEYGNGIFNHAYSEVRDRDFDKYAETKTKVVTKPTIPAKEVTNTTFVEQQRPTTVIRKKKIMTKAMRDNMSIPNALASIEATLKKRGVKVDKQ